MERGGLCLSEMGEGRIKGEGGRGRDWKGGEDRDGGGGKGASKGDSLDPIISGPQLLPNPPAGR